MSARIYGNPPSECGVWDLDWDEYMHYMYLPVQIPSQRRAIPERLNFARGLIEAVIANETLFLRHPWEYVYVTARRGYATPGNPLNRPGWHADGFGTDDINYVWTDRFPTLFAVQPFVRIPTDHIESVKEFERQVNPDTIFTFPDRTLLRLDSSVVHAAPEIPAPGGERSFLKVSFSNSRYNLRGNSINYDLEYEWEMFDRTAVRNDPAHAAQDGVPA